MDLFQESEVVKKTGESQVQILSPRLLKNVDSTVLWTAEFLFLGIIFVKPRYYWIYKKYTHEGTWQGYLYSI